MLNMIRIQKGCLADSKWMNGYAESPRMMTLDSFFLLINNSKLYVIIGLLIIDSDTLKDIENK
jgi:hypothetical protein